MYLPPPMIFSIIPIVVLVVIEAILALIVYLHNPRARANVSFAFFVISIISWTLSNYFADLYYSYLWTRLTYVGSLGIFYFFFQFVQNFPDRKDAYTAVIGRVVTGIFFILSVALILPSGLLVVGVVPYDSGVNVTVGKYFFLIPLYFVATLLLAFVKLATKLRTRVGQEKLQVQYLTLGFFISFGLGLAANLILPQLTGDYFYSQFGPYGLIFFIVLTALAIVRLNLLNITIITTEVFVVLLIVIQLGQLFFSPDVSTATVSIVVIVLTSVLSYFLVRSALREYRQAVQLTQLSKRLEEANVQLKHLDETKSEFVSIASHQLRTPLTVIKGYLSMLQEGTYGKIPTDQQAPMEKVYVSANRLIELVENLLSVSRIESGRMKYNYEQTSVTDMAVSVIDEISQKAKEKDLKLQFNRPKDDLPELMIDADKVRQVMMNLVDNAVKYTKRGSVIVSVRLAGLDSEPHVTEPSVVFEVKDTGLGVRREDIDRLFQKFIRGQGSSLVHTEGTGLGLYVGRMMVEAHGGNIWVTSRGEGLGSVFAFSLPLKGAPRAAAQSV